MLRHPATRFAILHLFGPLLLAVVARHASADSPLDDALAIWHMADTHDSAGADSQLSIHGDVRLNTAISEDQRTASRRRGGDGRVAELRGGYLSAGQGAGGELNISGDSMSVCVRVCDPSGRWGAPLISKHGKAARMVYSIQVAQPSSGYLFSATVGTTRNSHLLQARVPADLIDASAWHDVIVVCDGAKMRLFVDGLCLDEDFMLGALRQGNPVACLIGGAVGDAGEGGGGLKALVDHVAVWKRALTANEIEILSGGTSEVASQRARLNEKLQVPMQYFRPHHPDWNVGDCLPMYHDGVFHFYYLADKRHCGSKEGLGAHQWAHVSTRDLRHWQFHDLAVPITEQWEGSICTGSMFHHDDTYYAFYATRKTDRSGEYLSLATSPDGIHFTKQKPNPLAGPEPPYIVGPFRDPTVFRDPQTGTFHMLVTAAIKEPSLKHRGDCLAHLTSSDLRNWKQQAPFLLPGLPGAPECPDHFYWNGWYYLIFSHQGTARYRMSRSPLGPWTRPRLDTFGGPTEYVMKTASFGPNRRIGAAWLGKNGFAGNAVFREIVQAADGTLGTRLPEELTPPTKEPLRLTLKTLTEGVSGSAERIYVESPQGMSAGYFAGVPRNVRIRMRIVPGTSTNGWFGLCVRGSGHYATGTEIRCTPHLGKVELRDAVSQPRVNNDWHALEDVERLDRPFTLEVIVKDDMIDLCVDNRRTMINRVKDQPGDRLFFFAQDAEVTFENIDVRELK